MGRKQRTHEHMEFILAQTRLMNHKCIAKRYDYAPPKMLYNDIIELEQHTHTRKLASFGTRDAALPCFHT